MVTSLIFCMIVTILCCYSVHILLKERQETKSEISALINILDIKAMQRPLNITIRQKEANKSLHQGKNTIKDEMINITPIKRKLTPNNQYPIKPCNNLVTGFGLDMRA